MKLFERKLKEFQAKDEDELLELVAKWLCSDDEWYKGGEWVYPKNKKRKEKEINKVK